MYNQKCAQKFPKLLHFLFWKNKNSSIRAHGKSDRKVRLNLLYLQTKYGKMTIRKKIVLLLTKAYIFIE